MSSNRVKGAVIWSTETTVNLNWNCKIFAGSPQDTCGKCVCICVTMCTVGSDQLLVDSKEPLVHDMG